jgi:tetratricopeptide (TPR) repeat protein
LFVRLSLLGTADFGAWVSAPLLDLDQDQAEDALDALVSAHLVEVQVEEDGASRFRMHDLVRIYALEQIAVEEGPQERAGALQRLLSAWLSLTADAHRRAYGGDCGLHGHSDTWPLPDRVRDRLLASPMDWFRRERAGLVLAVTLAAQIGLDEACWDLAVTTVTLFEADYLIEDWRKTHETALEITRRMGNARGEAALLCSLGSLALIERPRDARHYLEPALRIFQQLRDVHGRALALNGLACCDRMSGDSERALIRYSQSLADCRAVGEDIGVVDALGNMALVQMRRENYGDAAQLLDEAFAQDGALEARRTVARLQGWVAELHMRTGDFFSAEQALTSVLENVTVGGDRLGEAYALAGLGAVRIRQRRYDIAEANLSSAVEISRQLDCNLVLGPVLLSLAELSLAKADRERASALVSKGLVTFSETGPAPVMRARFLEIKARIEDEAGNPRTADAARREALELAGDADAALSRTLTEAIAVSGGTGRGTGWLTPGQAVRGRRRADGACGRARIGHRFLITLAASLAEDRPADPGGADRDEDGRQRYRPQAPREAGGVGYGADHGRPRQHSGHAHGCHQGQRVRAPSGGGHIDARRHRRNAEPDAGEPEQRRRHPPEQQREGQPGRRQPAARHHHPPVAPAGAPPVGQYPGEDHGDREGRNAERRHRRRGSCDIFEVERGPVVHGPFRHRGKRQGDAKENGPARRNQQRPSFPLRGFRVRRQQPWPAVDDQQHHDDGGDGEVRPQSRSQPGHAGREQRRAQ